ncbi:serine/threonine protein kinase, partial [Actinomadura adrarensis]
MDPLNPSDPHVIGGIKLFGRLGEGGMGEVYFGVTPDADPVAVKVIRDGLTTTPAIRDRFDREIKVMDMVRGPGVAGLVAAAAP